MPGEREEAHRHGDADVDTDLPAVGVADEFTCEIAALRINDRTVGVGARVHDGKALVEILAALDAQHGTEHLVAADGHILSHMVEDRRADEVAALIAFDRVISAVEHELGAFRHALVDVGEHLFIMLFIGDRSELGGLVPRGANLDLLRLFFELCDEFIGNRFLHHAAGKRHTALPRAAVSGVDNARDRALQCGVRHDERVVFRLAKRLTALARSGGALIDLQAHGRGTDEGDALDIRMVKNGVDFIARAGHDVDNAVWHTRFFVDLGEQHRGLRRQRCSFEHHSVAARNTGRRHPAERDHGGEIHGHDPREHADRLTVLDRVIPARSVHEAFAHHQRRHLCGKLRPLFGFQHVALGFRPDLAILFGDAHGELFHIFDDQVADLVKDLRAFDRRHGAPARICRFRRSDRFEHLVVCAAGRLPRDLTRARVVQVVPGIGFGILEFSVDKILQSFNSHVLLLLCL